MCAYVTDEGRVIAKGHEPEVVDYVYTLGLDDGILHTSCLINFMTNWVCKRPNLPN